MSDIDWTSELRKIEREYSGLPPEPSAEQVRVKRAAEQRAGERKHQKAALAGALARTVVVLLLAVALHFWPYAPECGFGLSAYLASVTLVVAGGVWAAAWAWRGRLPKLHVVSLLLVLWGLTLAGLQVLPRAGYLTIGTAPHGHWSCAATTDNPR